MQRIDVVVIGGGQAGLAISYCLRARHIDHVVIERGRIGERWRSERWDSLRLLTPNWQSRLPGYAYRGADSEGFMSAREVVTLLENYAAGSGAPVLPHTRVLRVAAHGHRFVVRTDRGDFDAANVVIATGYADVPARPACAATLSTRVHQLSPTAYRNHGSLPPGGVLIVGASASGAQLAEELANRGRDVTLAVGQHIRLPRRYRGADIMAWLDRVGALDEPIADVRDPAASRAQPSLQLIGSAPPRDLDLLTLSQKGVRLAGHLTELSGERAKFALDLEATVTRAELKLKRVLGNIDRYIARSGAYEHAWLADPPAPIAPTRLGALASIDLRAERISSVIWATGFRRDYRWLDVRVLDGRRELIHTRGITPAPGLYALGLRFQHTRKSNFIDGVGVDAEYLARDIAARLGVRESFAA